MMGIFEGITPLGAVLSAFTLLTVCKVAVDIIWNEPEAFMEAIFVVGVGSVLAASVLFWGFDT